MSAVANETRRPMRLDHLFGLTDSRGILEHANGTVPRLSHGYCTDDNARLLSFAVLDSGRTPGSEMLAHLAMRFVLDAQDADGRIRNRMAFTRRWTDEPSTDDCWGRAVRSFGTAAAWGNDSLLRRRGLVAFERSARLRSPWMRSQCFAALGAAEVLATDPSNSVARSSLADAADRISDRFRHLESLETPAWTWPERALTYANAVLPDVLIASGHLLSRPRDLARGVELLDWLFRVETNDGHLSVTPVGGRRFGDRAPAFDQQPIEVGALADAARRAWVVTGDPRWSRELANCRHWFLGHNDLGVEMYDRRSFGGYDGLTPNGPNLNQGAESTLAMLSTLQDRAIA